MKQYILALDQGTTSSRSVIFDRFGQIVAMAQKEFTQSFPKPGWVEHDAEEIWTSQRTTIQEALKNANLSARNLAAIGITNQRETTILWDRHTGEPLAPAIVWQDRRTTELCASLKVRGLEADISRTTGLLLDPYFSGTKLAWLLDKIEGGRLRAARGELCFGTVDSWLIWKLTAGQRHVTDRTNASRTLLMDLSTNAWAESLLSLFEIPAECLPTIIDSTVTPQFFAKLDDVDVPICGIAGDQQAALFGQGCTHPQMAKNTYGTGCFLLMNTGHDIRYSSHRLLTTAACTEQSSATSGTQKLGFALEGSVFVGGAVVQWLRDGLGLIKESAEIEALVASVPDNGGIYMVPAFTGLGSPHWDPNARGMLIGLTRGTQAGHVARAALESIAFQSTELLQCMAADAQQRPTEIRVDGGACRNNLLMQIQADLMGVPVIRPTITETTALGAAYLAGLGVGIWSSTAEIESFRKVDRIFDPTISADEAAERMTIWSRAVTRAKNWAEIPS